MSQIGELLSSWWRGGTELLRTASVWWCLALLPLVYLLYLYRQHSWKMALMPIFRRVGAIYSKEVRSKDGLRRVEVWPRLVIAWKTFRIIGSGVDLSVWDRELAAVSSQLGKKIVFVEQKRFGFKFYAARSIWSFRRLRQWPHVPIKMLRWRGHVWPSVRIAKAELGGSLTINPLNSSLNTILFLADSGSGKTASMVGMVAEILRKYPAAEAICATTKGHRSLALLGNVLDPVAQPVDFEIHKTEIRRRLIARIDGAEDKLKPLILLYDEAADYFSGKENQLHLAYIIEVLRKAREANLIVVLANQTADLSDLPIRRELFAITLYAGSNANVTGVPLRAIRAVGRKYELRAGEFILGKDIDGIPSGTKLRFPNGLSKGTVVWLQSRLIRRALQPGTS